MNPINLSTVWALIPARGGSVRIPEKNLKPIAGKSLVERTVMTAKTSRSFARVFVSTDDQRIAKKAALAGAEVPFLRPPEFSHEHASSLSVLLHFIDFAVRNEPDFSSVSAVCLLQPTSPMLKVEHLQQALRVFKEGHFNSLSSMKKAMDPPEWMFRADNSLNRAEPECPEGIEKARSEFPERYIENGAIYFAARDLLLNSRRMYDFDNHGIYRMSEQDSIDIDFPSDWDYAEYLLKTQES